MKTFLTVNQTAERFPAFTRAGLRYLIFNAHTNGFDTCLRRIGRKVLICEEEFYEYINNSCSCKDCNTSDGFTIDEFYEAIGIGEEK